LILMDVYELFGKDLGILILKAMLESTNYFEFSALIGIRHERNRDDFKVSPLMNVFSSRLDKNFHPSDLVMSLQVAVPYAVISTLVFKHFE
jgi:hypothetical protein